MPRKEKRLRATDHLPGPAGGVGSGPSREFWILSPRCWRWSPLACPPLAECWDSPPPRCRCSRSSAAGFVAAAAAGSAVAASACRRRRPRCPPGQSAPCPRSRLQHDHQLNLLSTSESENCIKLNEYLFSIFTHLEIRWEFHWGAAFEMYFQYLENILWVVLLRIRVVDYGLILRWLYICSYCLLLNSGEHLKFCNWNKYYSRK